MRFSHSSLTIAEDITLRALRVRSHLVTVSCVFFDFPQKCFTVFRRKDFRFNWGQAMDNSIRSFLALLPREIVPHIANILTLSRVLLILVLLPLMAIEQVSWYWLVSAVALYTVLTVTDMLDGKVAQLTKPTRLGAMMDPLADKIVLVVCAFVIVGSQKLVLGHFTTFLLGCIVIRELIVPHLRSAIEKSGRSIMESTVVAKWKTALQMVSLGLLMFGETGDILIESLVPWSLSFFVLGGLLLLLATVLTMVSLGQYLIIASPVLWRQYLADHRRG